MYPISPSMKKELFLESDLIMIKTLLVLLVMAFLQLGCATAIEPIKFSAPATLKQGEAAVYLYRTDLHSLKGAYPLVFLDEEEQGRLEHQTYKVWFLKPGEYEWTLKAGSTWDELGASDSWEIREQKITLDVTAGKYYFLRLKPSAQANVFGWRDAKFGLVDEKKATREMKNSTLSLDAY